MMGPRYLLPMLAVVLAAAVGFLEYGTGQLVALAGAALAGAALALGFTWRMVPAHLRPFVRDALANRLRR